MAIYYYRNIYYLLGTDIRYSIDAISIQLKIIEKTIQSSTRINSNKIFKSLNILKASWVPKYYRKQYKLIMHLRITYFDTFSTFETVCCNTFNASQYICIPLLFAYHNMILAKVYVSLVCLALTLTRRRSNIS